MGCSLLGQMDLTTHKYQEGFNTKKNSEIDSFPSSDYYSLFPISGIHDDEGFFLAMI